MKLGLIVFSILFTSIYAQKWVQGMLNSDLNFYELKDSVNQFYSNKSNLKGSGYKPFMRWAAFMEPRVYPSGQRVRNDVDLKSIKEQMSIRSNANWQSIGPNNFDLNNPISSFFNTDWSGRVNVIEYDPNNNQIIYAGTPSGGLWKSTDGGVNWIPKTDKIAAIGVSAIEINPNNTQEIWIGTGDKNADDTYSIGVIKSTDGGNTWTQVNLNFEVASQVKVRKIQMLNDQTNVLYCATNVGLYKTIDGGATWEKLISEDIWDLEIHPDDDNLLFLSSRRLIKSNDGGLNFSVIENGTPISDDIGRMEIELAPSNPEVVYLLGCNEIDGGYAGVWKSNNRGGSFTLQSAAPNILGYDDNGAAPGGQGWYDLDFAVHPQNENEIFVGGILLFRSTDGGLTWNSPSNYNYHPNSHGDIHYLGFNGDRLICGNDGGIYWGSNYGNGAWDYLSSDLSIHQIYRFGIDPQNSDRMIVGAQDNGYNLRNNNNWYFLGGGDGMECIIHPTNPNVIYASWQNANLDKSTDGGQNFVSINPTVSNEYAAWTAPFEMDRFNYDVLYLGYENIMKSADAGLTWNAISNFNAGSLVSIQQSFQDGNMLYAASMSNVFVTMNGGVTWTDITAGLPNKAVTFMHVDPMDDQTIYVGFSGYELNEKIYVTADGGNTWENISYNLPNLPLNCIEIDETTGGIYVGMDVGVYYLDDNVSVWQPYFDNLPNVVINELEVIEGEGVIKVATFGRGVWQSPIYSPESGKPQVDFISNSTGTCEGSPVLFSDNSVGAAPNTMQWTFNGGTPVSSNEVNPTVVFPSTGTFEVSLTVSNSFGDTTLTEWIDVNYATEVIHVEVLTDLYPEESSWKLMGTDGRLITQGGPYNNTYTLYEDSVCVNEGCYEFLFLDSFGDGLMADAHYKVFLQDETQALFESTNFTFSQLRSFCTDGTVVGLKEQEKLIQMYPNPSKGLLHINVESVYETKVYDLNGKLLLETLISPENTQIDLSSLHDGMYIIRLKNDITIWSSIIELRR